MIELHTPINRVTPTGIAQALSDMPPVIGRQQAEWDRRKFLAKWQNSATPEELAAEAAEHLHDRVRALYAVEGAYSRVARRTGLNVERVHAIVDPEWGERYRTEVRQRHERRVAARRVVAA